MLTDVRSWLKRSRHKKRNEERAWFCVEIDFASEAINNRVATHCDRRLFIVYRATITTLWEGMYGDFEECVGRTPLTFHQFWHEALGSPTLPCDSYEAEERQAPHANPGDVG